MHKPLGICAAALLLAACGGEAAPSRSPLAAPSPSSAPPAPAAPAASNGGPSAPPSSEPSVLTDDQTARDRALAPRVEAILDAFGNFDASLSPDGKTVLFRSSRDGLPELFLGEVAKPAVAPKKIVGGPERVATATFTPDGKYVLFTRDSGANELFHIYRCKPDGSDLVDLTPADGLHRQPPLVPLHKPDTMIFSAASPTSPETKVYVQPIAQPGEAKVVYTNPAPSFAVDVDPAGTHALVVTVVSPSEQSLSDVDLKTGQARAVYPASGKRVGLTAAAYAHDGKRIFVATDDGGETAHVHALDAKTLAVKATYDQSDPAKAGISDVRVSPRGDRIAVVVDAGNHNEVRIHDATSLKMLHKVDAPLGNVEAGPFSLDGARFTMLESTPNAPTDVFVVDARSGAVKPLRHDARKGLGDLPALAITIETVKAFDGISIPVNLYLPKDLPAGKKLPVIAEFHGGPASSSAISWNFFARFYTSLGYAFVEPNIRGSTGFGRAYEMADNKEKRGDALKDVASVNAWIKSQAWADPDRVVIFGGSYGGYLVLMGLTRQTGMWRAGIDLVGVSNLFTFLKSTDQMIRAAFVDEFGDIDKDKALLEQYSPYAQVDKITAPLFVYQGQNDPRVPRPESDQIVANLRSRKVPVEYMVAPNEGHSIDRKESRIAFATRTARFLADNMK